MANKMEDVATLLGVALGEKFKIKGYQGDFYLDSTKGLLQEPLIETNRQLLYAPSTLKVILVDTDLVVKYPKTFEIGTLVRIIDEESNLYNCVGVISKYTEDTDEYEAYLLTIKDNTELVTGAATIFAKVEDVEDFFKNEYNTPTNGEDTVEP